MQGNNILFLKELLFSSTLFSVCAHYFQIKKINVCSKDVLSDVPNTSLTSCVLQCMNTKYCAIVGLKTKPGMAVTQHCYLLKENKEPCNKIDMHEWFGVRKVCKPSLLYIMSLNVYVAMSNVKPSS